MLLDPKDKQGWDLLVTSRFLKDEPDAALEAGRRLQFLQQTHHCDRIRTTVRPRLALTAQQAAALLGRLPPLARALVGLALLSGVRRGELFGLRWMDIDDGGGVLHVRQAIYEGVVSTPKTAAGSRQVPLSGEALQVIADWRQHVGTVAAEALVFATRSGKPISPNNVLRRWVVPACQALNLPRVTWLTLRRTFASWAHKQGVPGKVVAQLMGHAQVGTTLNIYTQPLDGASRLAADALGRELFAIVRGPEETSELTH